MFRVSRRGGLAPRAQLNVSPPSLIRRSRDRRVSGHAWFTDPDHTFQRWNAVRGPRPNRRERPGCIVVCDKGFVPLGPSPVRLVEAQARLDARAERRPAFHPAGKLISIVAFLVIRTCDTFSSAAATRPFCLLSYMNQSEMRSSRRRRSVSVRSANPPGVETIPVLQSGQR